MWRHSQLPDRWRVRAAELPVKQHHEYLIVQKGGPADAGSPFSHIMSDYYSRVCSFGRG
jgi:hypothetical protein